MNNELDFNKYDDVMVAKDYDGFIDPRGYFYRVNAKERKLKTKVDHNLWADEFMKIHGNNFRNLNFKASGLFTLSQISSIAEALVHIYGFIYYSHDAFMNPIIILPNPMYNNCSMTSEQNDALFEIMLLNNEDPFNNPIFTESDVYYYTKDEGVEDNYGKI